ncbi:MAG: hypothetical protein JW944_07040 [Deltaproteobacteria bacterium]|nr:hypothetical protein [Deltaproteobacteria bacterium]
MTDNLKERQDSTPTGTIRWDFSWPRYEKEERYDLLYYLEDRFGIDTAVFDDYLLLKKNKSWWLLRKSDYINQAALLKVWMTGLKAFQDVGRFIKPTTRMIQVFGHYAIRCVLQIYEDDIKKLSEGKHISSDKEMDNGYIILSFRGAILGLGLYIDGMVTSQMPRRDLILFVG